MYNQSIIQYTWLLLVSRPVGLYERKHETEIWRIQTWDDPNWSFSKQRNRLFVCICFGVHYLFFILIDILICADTLKHHKPYTHKCAFVFFSSASGCAFISLALALHLRAHSHSLWCLCVVCARKMEHLINAFRVQDRDTKSTYVLTKKKHIPRHNIVKRRWCAIHHDNPCENAIEAVAIENPLCSQYNGMAA